MTLRLSVFIALVAGAALLPASAYAGTLDQQQADFGGGDFSIGTNQTAGETFTAGITGQVDQVDLALSEMGPPTADLIVEIRSVSGGVPTSTVLASTSIPNTGIPAVDAFVPITFASQASVTAGMQYAIVASSATPPGLNYRWAEAATANPYAGGNAVNMAPASSGIWNTAPQDLAFKTYVVPPVSPAASSTPTGKRAAALASCKKRARKQNWSRKRLRKCKRKANLLPV